MTEKHKFQAASHSTETSCPSEASSYHYVALAGISARGKSSFRVLRIALLISDPIHLTELTE